MIAMMIAVQMIQAMKKKGNNIKANIPHSLLALIIRIDELILLGCYYLI